VNERLALMDRAALPRAEMNFMVAASVRKLVEMAGKTVLGTVSPVPNTRNRTGGAPASRRLVHRSISSL
jgi:hypothetical protein